MNATGGQCENCMLTVMCWMNGGIREGGCSGPSWLMTCCVPQVTRNDDDTIPSTAGLRSASGGTPFILANSLGESIANLGRDECKFFLFYFINGAFFRLVGVGCVRGKTRFYFFLNNNILDSNQIVRRKNRVARSTPPARTRSPRYRMKVGRSALFLLDSLRAIIPIVSRCIKTNNRMEMTAAERYGARVRRPRRARRFRILCVCLLLP